MFKFRKETEAKTKEILQAIGSRDRATSLHAMETLAALMSPKIAQVLEQLPTSNRVFTTEQYSTADPPSIPIDTFFGNGEGTIVVGSISQGRFTSEIRGAEEYYFTPYKLSSAVSFKQSYMSRSRPQFSVVSNSMTRMTEEVLLQAEDKRWRVVAGTLGAARTGGVSHLSASVAKAAGGTRRFQVADLNALITKSQRLRNSWAGGTPVSRPGSGLSLLLGSPEFLAEVRSFSYQPMNTLATPDTVESTALGLPDSVRSQIFNAPGAQSIWGVGIESINELGVGRYFNYLIDEAYTPSGSDPSFSSGAEEIVLAIDTSVPSFMRMLAVDEEIGSTFDVQVDDQWAARDKTVGFWGEMQEAVFCGDNKAILGLVW